MIELSVIRDLVAIFGVIAGLSYYVLTVRNSQKMQKTALETRQAQFFMQIYSELSSKEFQHDHDNFIVNAEWDSYEDFMQKYGHRTGDGEIHDQGSHVATYFEGVGLLVKRGLLDVSLVDDLMSSMVIRFWEKFRPLVLEMREAENMPQISEWLEYLYNRVRPLAEEQHPELAT